MRPRADLDFSVWLIRGQGRDILVDTGFNAKRRRRGRKADAPIRSTHLIALGPRPRTIRTSSSPICITTTPAISIAFPMRVAICRREMSYATGRCMCNGMLRHRFR